MFLAHIEMVYGNYEFRVEFHETYQETRNEFVYPLTKDNVHINFDDIVGKINNDKQLT